MISDFKNKSYKLQVQSSKFQVEDYKFEAAGKVLNLQP
jgi:hypothetical protein